MMFWFFLKILFVVKKIFIVVNIIDDLLGLKVWLCCLEELLKLMCKNLGYNLWNV